MSPNQEHLSTGKCVNRLAMPDFIGFSWYYSSVYKKKTLSGLVGCSEGLRDRYTVSKYRTFVNQFDEAATVCGVPVSKIPNKSGVQVRPFLPQPTRCYAAQNAVRVEKLFACQQDDNLPKADNARAQKISRQYQGLNPGSRKTKGTKYAEKKTQNWF